MYGPVRTVVWEERSCEASPYPDFGLVELQFVIPKGVKRGWHSVAIEPNLLRVRSGNRK